MIPLHMKDNTQSLIGKEATDPLQAIAVMAMVYFFSFFILASVFIPKTLEWQTMIDVAVLGITLAVFGWINSKLFHSVYRQGQQDGQEDYQEWIREKSPSSHDKNASLR